MINKSFGNINLEKSIGRKHEITFLLPTTLLSRRAIGATQSASWKFAEKGKDNILWVVMFVEKMKTLLHEKYTMVVQVCAVSTHTHTHKVSKHPIPFFFNIHTIVSG